MKRKIFKSSFLLTVVLIMALTLTGTAIADDPVPPPDGSIGSVSPQDETGPSVQNLIAFSQTIFGTDYVTGGCGGMRNTGACNVGITISGIGAGTVNQALLYWHGPTNTADPTANASVTFAGNPITGANIGFSDNNCWGFVNSQAYVGDVTAFVSGDGNYTLSGFGSGFINTNGASLLVFFDDGVSTNNRDIVLFHGNDSNISNPFDPPGWNVTLPGINYTAGMASMELHVADGQTFTDDALILNAATLVPTGAIFQGFSVPGDNNGPTNNGRLWDIRTDDITSFLTPGPNTLTLTTGVASDCLSLVVAAINLPAGAAPEQPNQPPTADANGPYSGDEGSPISIDGTGSSDPENDPLTYTWSYTAGLGVDSGASCTFGNANAASTTITCTDDGTYDLTLTVNDGTVSDSNSTTVDVANVAPMVSINNVSPTLLAVGESVTASGSFTDPGTNDTHTASWDWGDASSSAGTVSGLSVGPDSHTYTAPGIYTIELTVTDDDTGEGTATFQFVVVYDPSAGFVTGGGWIDSPAGAYIADPSLTGKANFGFVSKYKKGATTPDGNTEFQFHAAGMNFHSESYEWLVVTQSGTNAQFKGTGTINGGLDPNGNAFKFMLWAGDGSPDTFRIRIWWEDTDGTEYDVYDNGFNQMIGGGSIVIHKAK